MSRATGPQFDIRLRALPAGSDPSGIRRLRALLKFALRTLRLKCVSIREVTAVEEGKPT